MQKAELEPSLASAFAVPGLAKIVARSAEDVAQLV